MKTSCPVNKVNTLQPSRFGHTASRCVDWAARLMVALGAMAGSTGVMAASGGDIFGTITYRPLGGQGAVAPSAIPTVGGIGLVLLSAFLLLVFWRIQRRSGAQGARFMVIAVACGALTSGVGGVKLVSVAMANVGGYVYMNNEAGGTLTIYEEDGNVHCVSNSTTIPLRIISMVDVFTQPAWTPENEKCGPADNSPEHEGCEEGMVLQPEGICGIRFSGLVT